MKRLMLAVLLVGLTAAALPAQEWVRVEWFGHSCFRLILKDGYRVVFDPMNQGRMRYTLPDSADIVLMTHDHFDHNNWKPLNAEANYMANGREPEFKLMTKKKKLEALVEGVVKAHEEKVEFYTVPSWHDDSGGKERGANGIICLQTAGIRFVHLGDLGTLLDSAQIADIGPVDVLFIPVGGKYTIDDAEAEVVCRQLSPKLVFPMHFHTERLGTGLGLKKLEDFLYRCDRIRLVADFTLILTPANLPEEMQVVRMQFHP